MKKEKLLILGDSFALDKAHPSESSWSDLLEKSRKYQITNLSAGGSSLWFSFKNFLRYQQEYDKIIFVVTFQNRLYFPISDDVAYHHHNSGSLDRLSNIKKTTINLTQIEEIDAVLFYFKHIMDMEERSVYQKLVIKEIRETRPDAILIPAFPDSIFDHQSDCLMDISDRETEKFGLTMHAVLQKYIDNRQCHMIDENNQILYEHVLCWLDGAPVVINKNDFKKMTKDDFEKCQFLIKKS